MSANCEALVLEEVFEEKLLPASSERVVPFAEEEIISVSGTIYVSF
ncbi:MAG: hypothetical protein KDK65_07315 [Chlamydiia bacterium]|nr:hypothetical protein [Chlamydiia bacterium]